MDIHHHILRVVDRNIQVRRKGQMALVQQKEQNIPQLHGKPSFFYKLSRTTVNDYSNECKKRKIKCLQDEGSQSCQRCTVAGRQCILTPPHQIYRSFIPSTQSYESPNWSTALPHSTTTVDHETRFAEIDRKVHLLTRQVEKLQAELCASRSEDSSRLQTTREVRQSNQDYIDTLPQELDPVQPQFVGATRPAFDLNVARSSMNNMGIPTDLPSGSATDDPVATLRKEPLELRSLFQPLRNYGKEKILALVEVFQEELNPVYPYVNIPDLISLVHHLFERYGDNGLNNVQEPDDNQDAVGQLEFMVFITFIACAIAVDSLGRNKLSQQLVNSAQKFLFDDVGSGRATYEEILISVTVVRLRIRIVIPTPNSPTRASTTFTWTRTY
jgi:hypothetical protein